MGEIASCSSFCMLKSRNQPGVCTWQDHRADSMCLCAFPYLPPQLQPSWECSADGEPVFVLTRAIPLPMDSVFFAEVLSALCRPPELFSKLCQDFCFDLVQPCRDAV